MQRMITTAIIALGVLLFPSAHLLAQTSPNVSTAYTSAQIDEMYKKHKMSNPQDTYPSLEWQKTLLRDFPDAREIDWEKSDLLYEVEFEIGRMPSRDYKAYYDMDGKLVMYQEEIPTRAIPAVVRNAALAQYPNFRFEEAEKIVKGKDTLYKVDLEKGEYDVRVILDLSGTILNEGVD